jgi:hypothetical protein
MKMERKNLNEKMQKDKIKSRVKKQVFFNILLIALLLFVLNSSILIYPFEGMQTRNTTIDFKWLGFVSYALVDDNPDFTSPLIVEKGKVIELKPSKYYWCVPFFKNCLRKASFEIQSEVSLVGRKIKAEEENATYMIENTGNVAAKVEIKNLLNKLLTGLFILEPHATKLLEINETANIIASQK